MERLLLDTNVLVRFILGEPEEQAAAAAILFQRCDEGSLELAILPMVAAETIFVLSSFYEKGRKEIADVLSHILANPGIACDERDILQRALQHFAQSKAHFVDCYLAASSELLRLPVASFDRDFDELPGAKRLDPARG